MIQDFPDQDRAGILGDAFNMVFVGKLPIWTLFGKNPEQRIESGCLECCSSPIDQFSNAVYRLEDSQIL